MVSEDNVRKVVEDLVLDRFPGAKILSVSISEDLDYEDDLVLRVKVVFDPESDKLDAGVTSGFLRYLRPKLSDIGVKAFPVMSFVSGRDNGAAA